MEARDAMTTQRTKIRKDLTQAIRKLEDVQREVTVFMQEPTVDLVGTKEAAEILGVQPNVISTRLRRGRFPQPIVTLSCGPIWHREDIEYQRDFGA
jgi:DNA-directed RNA polymerase specialized sigma24 family protein